MGEPFPLWMQEYFALRVEAELLMHDVSTMELLIASPAKRKRLKRRASKNHAKLDKIKTRLKQLIDENKNT